jgi:hypothetical protein
MSTTQAKPQSSFGLALAARKGEIEPDRLHGAARKLFRDRSLSDSQLSDYAGAKSVEPAQKLPGQQPHIRAKR